MAGRRPLDMSVLWGCHPPGMRKGIDAPLCGGSNRRMDPRTGLPYFPNQRLSVTVDCDALHVHVFDLTSFDNRAPTSPSFLLSRPQFAGVAGLCQATNSCTR